MAMASMEKVKASVWALSTHHRIGPRKRSAVSAQPSCVATIAAAIDRRRTLTRLNA